MAAIIGAISAVFFLAAADWHFERVLRPALLVGAGSSNAQLIRWGAFTDMLGYYLLLVPLFWPSPLSLAAGSSLQ